MFIDTSGSMRTYGKILACLKQVLIMSEFCNRNRIPFEILGFGSNPVLKLRDDGDFTHSKCEVLLSSIWSKKSYKKKVGKIWKSILEERPRVWAEGNTPLTETLLSVATRCHQFKEQTNVQKLHVMVLTDGDANSVKTTSRVVFINDTNNYRKTFSSPKERNLIECSYQYIRSISDSLTLFSMCTHPSTTLTGKHKSRQIDLPKPKQSLEGIDIYEKIMYDETLIDIRHSALDQILVKDEIKSRKIQRLICQTLINNIV